MDKRKILGQVYTPPKIASFMVNLLMQYCPSKIIEPCFGKGAFLKELSKYNTEVIGIEIDTESFIQVKNNYSEMKLFNMDFFDYEDTVDGIIINPPYIEQRLLTNKNNPDYLKKEIIRYKTKADEFNIASTSNLYIYFILKCYHLLKENGALIAIIPNTWISSHFGISFKKFLLKNFIIKKVIEFNKDVFEDASVESCIVELIKKPNNENNIVSFIKINEDLKIVEKVEIEQNLLETKENWKELNKQNNSILCKLKDISYIRRGLSVDSNDFFIKNTIKIENKENSYFKQIICSPKEIDGYSTSNLNKTNYLLLANTSKEYLPSEIKNYIEDYEKEILSGNVHGFKIVKEKIKNNPYNWYRVKVNNPSLLIFSYFIRRNKKFILNLDRIIVRGNFYEIEPKQEINPFLLLSILNSSYARCQLEFIGRSYGEGLLKIQKYELEEFHIINPFKIKEKDIDCLILLGKALSEVLDDGEEIIDQIDLILEKYVGGGYKEKERELNEKRNLRKGE